MDLARFAFDLNILASARNVRGVLDHNETRNTHSCFRCTDRCTRAVSSGVKKELLGGTEIFSDYICQI